MTLRIVAGTGIAMLVALVAHRARSLSASGAVAAIVVGSLAVAVSWSWGALVVVYFVVASVVSRRAGPAGARRTASIVAKQGPRDAAQVLANGGVFAIAALGMLVRPDWVWAALALGALAASEADTWATEIGTSVGGEPRSILTMRRVPAGTSGGVTLAGTLASVAGAAVVALTAALLGFPRAVYVAAWFGGIGGAIVDSLIGATLQSRRWCDACNAATERKVHDCGATTRRAGGLAWIDNDTVNLLCGVAGGLFAASLAA